MKRAGFTMIELIFVIVILGILAAVAVPKLAATRTDAQVAKISSEAATLVSELGSFYTAQGTFLDKNSSQITNTKLLVSNGDIKKDGNITMGDGSKNACLIFKFVDPTDGNVTVSAPTTPTGSVCKAVKKATVDLQKAFHFGGSNVAY